MRDTPAEVGAILRSLPDRIRADAPNERVGVFHFEIDSASEPAWTIEVAPPRCSVMPGHVGDPVCVIGMDEATFIAIETGAIDPVQAFVKGKIRVTNLHALKRYDQCFHRFHDLPT
jgi:SCP-2 sterol transfer family